MYELSHVKLTELSKRIGIPMNDLTDQFNAYLTQAKLLYPGKQDTWYDDRARHLVFAKYTDALRSQAASFDIVLFYTGEAVDYNARTREMALVQWKQDPQKAVNAGVVDGSGVPIDTREWLVEPASGIAGKKNPNHKKPLQPFWQRRVIGFATRYGEPQVKLFAGTIRDTVDRKTNTVTFSAKDRS